MAVGEIASLGIMEDKLRDSLRPINTIVLLWSERFQEGLQLGHNDTEKSAEVREVINTYKL